MKNIFASTMIALVATTFSLSASAAILVAGSANAKVQLLVYGDLECPFTKLFMNERLPKIEAEYGDRVGVSFAHFPLNFHAHATEAAAAAECARQYGHGKEFVLETFKSQDQMNQEFYFLGVAKRAGISDEEGFQSCMALPKTGEVVATDKATGTALGVVGTPNIWVNGTSLKGVYPAADFKAAIDSALAK